MFTHITCLESFEKEVLPHIQMPETAKANSKWIESLILGVPIPIVVNNGKVIQGADIIASYGAFMKDELVMEGDIASKFKGLKKSTMDMPTIRAIKTNKIMFTYIKIDDSIANTIFNK